MNKNLKNILSLFSMEIAVRLIAFGAVTYLARTLGASNFGLINIGLAVMNSALVLGSSGLILVGTRKVAANNERLGALIMRIFKLRTILSALAYLIISAILFIFVKDLSTRNVVLVYLLYIFPAALFIDWYFQGKQQMGNIAIARIGGMIVYFIFILFFIKQANEFINGPRC